MVTSITQEQGYTGLNLKIPRIVTTATLVQVTAVGWYNNTQVSSGQPGLNPQDLVAICYSYGASGENTELFKVSIANGVVTLSLDASGVILPVVSGHFANFSGTTGLIADDGYLPSNASLTNVVMQDAASVSGNIPKYNDVNGTLIDSGLAESNIVAKNAVNTFSGVGSIILPKINGTEASNAVTASGVAGVITTSSLSTAGGGSYAITWTNTVMTATSVVLLTIAGGTNTTENITLKIVPGAGSGTLTIYNNTVATALNGTIFISYLVI